MTEIPRQHFVDIDPDFEPLSRPRSCTWPLPPPRQDLVEEEDEDEDEEAEEEGAEAEHPRTCPGPGAGPGPGPGAGPGPGPGQGTGPGTGAHPFASVKQEPGGRNSSSDFLGRHLALLEETEDDFDDEETLQAAAFHTLESSAAAAAAHAQRQQQQQQQQPADRRLQTQQQQQQQQGRLHAEHQQVAQLAPAAAAAAASSAAAAACILGGSSALQAAQRKSSSSRRNAWGNMSYADLITKAIDSSPDKRLTLAQIYDWMVKSVPYFKDKGDSNSSAGWKNSIRHNLSLHSRFMRMQNEGTGKSSWWMLNPEGGKSGKSPRRRAASMDNNSKFAKSRGRAAKKKGSLQEHSEGGVTSPGPLYTKWMESPNSHSNDDFDTWGTFRTRTSSDASNLSGRRSPFLPEHDDLGDGDIVHIGYPGGSASPLSSVSELTGPVSQRRSEGVMESLLDNMNLCLSPKMPQLAPDTPHSTAGPLLQKGPYSTTHTATMPPHRPPQDYLPRMAYGPPQMTSLSPVLVNSAPGTQPGFGSFDTPYNCHAGLLKELLTSSGERGREQMMTPVEMVVNVPGHGGGLPRSYGSQDHVGVHEGIKMIHNLAAHPGPRRHVPPVRRQGPSRSQEPNSCNMIPLTSVNLTRGPPRMTNPRTCMQMPLGYSRYGGAVPAHYGSSNGGYGGPVPAHLQGQYPERLPSDLDNVSLERLECDMESVLHETLMDGDALDFNFDPTGGPQLFAQRVKNNSHSWVSG